MSGGELRAYKVVLALCALLWAGALVAPSAGPRIEARYFPVRVDQRVEAVTRTPERLCFDWVFRKVRQAATDDLDVFLSADGIEGRMVVALIAAADGLPWRRAAAVPLGPARRRYCVAIPAGVPADGSIWLEATLWYPGFLGLWRVPSRAPVVGASALLRAAD